MQSKYISLKFRKQIAEKNKLKLVILDINVIYTCVSMFRHDGTDFSYKAIQKMILCVKSKELKSGMQVIIIMQFARFPFHKHYDEML